MTESYRNFVVRPLFFMLAVLILCELNTDTIPDVLLGTMGLYLLTAAARTGPLRWWRYPVGLVSILFALLMLAYTCQELLGREGFGGGAIKLAAVVGGSVGLAVGFETIAIWLLAVAAVLAFTNIALLPSSPLVAVALYVAVGRRYGFNVLFAGRQKANPDAEPAMPLPAAALSGVPETQRPSFFKLPPIPSLLLQGGALLALGGGFLARQLGNTVEHHGLITSLAIELLRVASLFGIICFVVGWIKNRRRKSN